MGNLFIETPVANLVAGMGWLQNTVTRRHNVRHMAWSRLLGARYKAVPVDGADIWHYRALKVFRNEIGRQSVGLDEPNEYRDGL